MKEGNYNKFWKNKHKSLKEKLMTHWEIANAIRHAPSNSESRGPGDLPTDAYKAMMPYRVIRKGLYS